MNSSDIQLIISGIPLMGAMFGLCLGGPVGLLAGVKNLSNVVLLFCNDSSLQVKLGGVAAVGGSILGYAGASVVREQRELRTYIDEHYVREPDLYVLSPKEEAELTRRLERPVAPAEPASRHLPPSRSGSRRGPAGYRRPSTVSSCSSAASSLAARRRAESFRSREVPSHLTSNLFQKICPGAKPT